MNKRQDAEFFARAQEAAIAVLNHKEHPEVFARPSKEVFELVEQFDAYIISTNPD